LDISGHVNKRVTCTACFQQIILQKPGSAWSHPLLRVLLCKVTCSLGMADNVSEEAEPLQEHCYLEVISKSELKGKGKLHLAVVHGAQT